MTLVPLFWSCLHLLVNYRMTCTDPKLASFGFWTGSGCDDCLAFIELARLLFGKPGTGYAGVALPQWRSPCRCRISAATVWLC